MGYCQACDKEFKIKDYTFLCPTCGGTKIDTIGGQGMSVVEMDAE
jgi:hydrogenase nickel incorporation protein HypA/HybF